MTGVVIGVYASIVVKLCNPGNIGICIGCFNRDITGALSLRQAAAGQFIQPEIIGFVLGSFIAALAFREFRSRAGSALIIRFLLGMFAAIGSLIFLGCPWQVYFRLCRGDWNALLGILGLFAGVALGVVFLRMGFSLGRNYPAHRALGWIVMAKAHRQSDISFFARLSNRSVPDPTNSTAGSIIVPSAMPRAMMGAAANLLRISDIELFRGCIISIFRCSLSLFSLRSNIA
jgi:YedE family putative selenium metabolism protein